jgi:hypothetical protein
MKSIAQLNAEIKAAKAVEATLKSTKVAAWRALRAAEDAFLATDPGVPHNISHRDPQWSAKWKKFWQETGKPHDERRKAATSVHAAAANDASANFRRANAARLHLVSQLRIVKALERHGRGVPLGANVMSVVCIDDGEYVEVRAKIAKGRYVAAEMSGNKVVRAIGPRGVRGLNCLTVIELPL